MARGTGIRPWKRGTEAARAASTTVVPNGDVVVTDDGGLFAGDGTTQLKDLPRHARVTDIDSRTATFPVESFGNPDTDYSASLLAAITASQANNGIVTHRPGKSYTARSTVPWTGPVRIDWRGAKITRSADAPNSPVLDIYHPVSTPQAVVAITQANRVWPGSTDATLVSRIEVASVAGWTVGDWGVIVGDDTIPGGSPARAQREGERFRVAAIDGNLLCLSRLVRVTLTTAIRVARMTEREVRLIDPYFTDDPASPTTRTAPMIQIRTAVRPRVYRPRFENLMSEGLRYVACVENETHHEQADKLRTSLTAGAWGYGVRDMSCNDSLHVGLRGSDLRHVYTSGAYESTAAGSPDTWRFGSTIGARIVNGSAGEVGHAAFDLHEEAAYCLFDKCSVAFNHKEPDGSQFAFQLRGRDNIIRDCTSIGPGAVSIRGFDGGGRHQIIGHVHTVPRGLSTASAFRIAYTDMTARGAAELSATVIAPAFAGTAVALLARKAVIRIPSLVVRTDSAQAIHRLTDIADSALLVDEMVVDLRGSTGETRIFSLIDSLSSVRVNRLVVLAGGAAWRVADLATLNGTVTVARIETDTAPAGGGFADVGATAVTSIGEIVVDQASNLTAAAVVGDTDLAPSAVGPARHILTAPLTADRTVTEPTAAAQGRSITYTRTAAATGRYRWIVGSESVDTGGWITRTWTGTAWTTTARGRTEPSAVAAPIPAAGSYAFTAVSGTSTSSASPNQQVRAQPWLLDRSVTIDRIGVEVTVAGGAGTKWRLGIYADNGNGYPGALVLDADAVAGDVVGMIEKTITALRLPAGLWWVAAVMQDAATTPPTVRVLNAWSPPVMMTLGTALPANGSVGAAGFTQSNVSAALPDTFSTSVFTTSLVPRVFVRTA
ncbi:hypothetical protein CH305_18570 [Rhodococcus sp. 15-649-2-2]|uniref:hypothetical protein n=1 Tax=Rhodococcus sp. 15-649-2-2 TaxID=2023140 RepID=UPI000B9B3603|nr:hypothetical protein [Rhodococcus sp. 15-649-2-2]OZE77241.1 hypothetical protein CH305_18570 [Rhodococcus sp. 15-649-2-2]